MNSRRWILAALIVPVIVVAGCSSFTSDQKPSISIIGPIGAQTMAAGETLQIESRARDDRELSRVELRVNGVQVDVSEIPRGERSYRVMQSWLPSDAGIYQIAVVAYDSKDQESEPASLTVSVGATATPTATPPPPPPETPTPTPTEAEGPFDPSGCRFDAKFVTDVTIPDNTEMEAGTEFVKTWRLRNSGTCNWGSGFQLVFVKGEQMSGPASVNVGATQAGSTVDVSVPLRAPQRPGTFRGSWRMRTPDGREFGDRPFVQIAVRSPATATPEATPSATAGPRPDLDITLVAGNLELLVGQPLSLRITVRNHGPGASEQPALVRAVLRSGLQLEDTLATLPRAGEGVAELSYTFDKPADLEVVVSVDPDNQILEGNEENNTEQFPLVVNPPLYVTDTITVTSGARLDLDDGASEEDAADIVWEVVEGMVRLALLNDAGAAPLSGEVDNVSYVLAAGLTWETEQLTLVDLTEGSLFGFRTSEGRIGYALVEAVLDDAHTSVRLTYRVWDWP